MENKKKKQGTFWVHFVRFSVRSHRVHRSGFGRKNLPIGVRAIWEKPEPQGIPQRCVILSTKDIGDTYMTTVHKQHHSKHLQRETNVPSIETCAASEMKIEGLSSIRPVTKVPPELHCPLCKEVMKDAVLTSKCYFRFFCDKCTWDCVIASACVWSHKCISR